MSAHRPSAAAILKTLAVALSGEALTAYFPEHSGAEIRQILAEAAEQLRGQEAPPSRIPDAVPEAAASPAQGGDGHFVLFSDGASRGNPGLAGAGIQILDRAKNEILAASKFLGQCTNNEAEYQALIFGLQEARRLGATAISIFLDSELIVRQLQGRYQVKNERLKVLFGQVRMELAKFKSHRVGHVPRNQNQRADEMANRGIDERARG